MRWQRGCDSASCWVHRYVGVLIGTAVFILLPALLVAGAYDCRGSQPGLRCAIAKLAFDDRGGFPDRKEAKAD
ncbi:MAG TPA: hypothetical protein VFP60_14790 [Pseudolabrys sp.]|nr:hypothetical protein [Pseudolabrys sp.]